MKASCRRGIVCLAAAWIAAAPMLTAAAAPQAAPQGEPTATAAFADWVEAWLARLLPVWSTAASETEPPAAPLPTEVLDLDDQTNELCAPELDPGCTDPETWPDIEPNG